MPEVKATPSIDFLQILGIFDWLSSGGWVDQTWSATGQPWL